MQVRAVMRVCVLPATPRPPTAVLSIALARNEPKINFAQVESDGQGVSSLRVRGTGRCAHGVFTFFFFFLFFFSFFHFFFPSFLFPPSSPHEHQHYRPVVRSKGLHLPALPGNKHDTKSHFLISILPSDVRR